MCGMVELKTGKPMEAPCQVCLLNRTRCWFWRVYRCEAGGGWFTCTHPCSHMQYSLRNWLLWAWATYIYILPTGAYGKEVGVATDSELVVTGVDLEVIN